MRKQIFKLNLQGAFMTRLIYTMITILIIFTATFILGCSEKNPATHNNSKDTASPSGSSTDDQGSGSTSDTDTDTDSDGDSDTDTDTDSDGDSDTDSDTDTDADSDADTDTNEGTDSTTEIAPPPQANNGPRMDYLYCEYKTTEETDKTFKGTLTIGNANEDYVWNGYSFTVWSVDLTTTSEITLVGLDEWNKTKYSQKGDLLTIDLGDNKYFSSEFLNKKDAANHKPDPLKPLVTLVVEGNKKGKYPYPIRCNPNYIRGDIIYPVYQDLPHSWWKGKKDLKAKDLIADEASYYKESAEPVKEGIFIYHPVHPTQINIGQPHGVGHVINGFDNLYIRLPNTMMAMGIAFNYEWFKFNPNYFCALGTKG
jgi:hypothetical protein